jgi:hypothetical protein
VYPRIPGGQAQVDGMGAAALIRLSM